jgi:hypothetical protein
MDHHRNSPPAPMGSARGGMTPKMVGGALSQADRVMCRLRGRLEVAAWSTAAWGRRATAAVRVWEGTGPRRWSGGHARSMGSVRCEGGEREPRWDRGAARGAREGGVVVVPCGSSERKMADPLFFSTSFFLGVEITGATWPGPEIPDYPVPTRRSPGQNRVLFLNGYRLDAFIPLVFCLLVLFRGRPS